MRLMISSMWTEPHPYGTFTVEKRVLRRVRIAQSASQEYVGRRTSTRSYTAFASELMTPPSVVPTVSIQMQMRGVVPIWPCLYRYPHSPQ
jgi:hypothetical protein